MSEHDEDTSALTEVAADGERPLQVPAELSVLPLRDTVLFPNSFMPLSVI